MKRQPSEWEKIIANEATDKQVISRIYKQLLQLNSRKINDPIKKWAKELNRHFNLIPRAALGVYLALDLVQGMGDSSSLWPALEKRELGHAMCVQSHGEHQQPQSGPNVYNTIMWSF